MSVTIFQCLIQWTSFYESGMVLCNWRTPYHTFESLTISNNDSDMHKLGNWWKHYYHHIYILKLCILIAL